MSTTSLYLSGSRRDIDEAIAKKDELYKRYSYENALMSKNLLLGDPDNILISAHMCLCTKFKFLTAVLRLKQLLLDWSRVEKNAELESRFIREVKFMHSLTSLMEADYMHSWSFLKIKSLI
jgi:hypothetical protein